jgi:hypothetical protein
LSCFWNSVVEISKEGYNFQSKYERWEIEFIKFKIWRKPAKKWSERYELWVKEKK